MRLHSSAAYVRKYAQLEDVRNPTGVSSLVASTRPILTFSQVETTIYTMCRKCRKPLLHAHHAKATDSKPNGGFAFCNSCMAPTTTCSIW